MSKFFDVAMEAAREAGLVLLAEHSRPQKISYKGDVDLVTETDKRSELLIVGRLRREFPEHRIVAEEGSGGAVGASRYEWHVDPLDGTTNFLNGGYFFRSVPRFLYFCRRGLEILLAGHVIDPFRGKPTDIGGRDLPQLRMPLGMILARIGEPVLGVGLDWIGNLRPGRSMGSQ